MENLKKVMAFIVCTVWAFATIGSTAYLLYYGKPQFAIATLAVSAMAIPYVRNKFNLLIK